jgi:hypothetical protein
MEYILEYPKSNANWFHLFIESIRIWWMAIKFRDYKENDLLIN